jgi:hypothetical protein
MMSAAAAIDLDAPAERVWQVVADLDAYPDWNPCFRQVRGTLRANERLDIDVGAPGKPPPDSRLVALVLAMHRRRGLRWLLLSPPGSTAGQMGERLEAGSYDVELVPLGPTRVRLVQRLTLPADPAVWPADRTGLRQLVEAMNDALRDRVAWSAANQPASHQFEGTIRIRSHCGDRPRFLSQRAGLLACLAELVGRNPRIAAA